MTTSKVNDKESLMGIWKSVTVPLVITVSLTGTVPSVAAEVFGKISSVEDCWRRLPTPTSGSGQQLPIWALITARSLPRTTAAMLELDWLHRTRNAIGPVLRGKMRWVAADANRCDYARATAIADLRREGLGDAPLADLKGGPDRWPAAERAALNFAHQMTVDAGSVTDAEVAELQRIYGDEKLVAMVLLLAYSNFQDRLLLTLGVPLEGGGPLAPVEVHFARDASPPPVPERARPEDLRGPPVPSIVGDPEWAGLAFEVLQTNLSSQRARDGRIRVPSFDEYLKKLPAGAPPPKAPVRIKWSLVCMGYQPLLASAWSACTRAFGEEAKQDRVFEECLFWVVTRTIRCFY
jgi:alkylhydroperoxidase family enzyme